MAPEAGLEPATFRLTAGRSTIELLWNPEGRNLQSSVLSVKLILPALGPKLDPKETLGEGVAAKLGKGEGVKANYFETVAAWARFSKSALPDCSVWSWQT